MISVLSFISSMKMKDLIDPSMKVFLFLKIKLHNPKSSLQWRWTRKNYNLLVGEWEPKKTSQNETQICSLSILNIISCSYLSLALTNLHCLFIIVLFILLILYMKYKKEKNETKLMYLIKMLNQNIYFI